MTFRRFYLSLLDRRATVYLALVVVSVGLLPVTWTMTAIACWIAVAAAGIAYVVIEFIYVKQKYPGVMIKVHRRPGPLDSMFDALDDAGVTPKKIKAITFESADINGSLDYYTDGKQRLLNAVRENPAMKITVYGRCMTGSVPEANIPNINIVPIQEKITRHLNLIETYEDQEYLWLEPFHDVIDRKHYFTTGAYLIKIDKSAVPKIKAEYAQLRRAA